MSETPSLSTLRRACPALLAGEAESLLECLYAPTVDWIRAWMSSKGGANDQAMASRAPRFVSISGLPGTGKSTLAKAVSALLEELHGLRVAVVSLDDIYLTKRQRRTLSHAVHPLLGTRGVPGTHDVQLGLHVLRSLATAQPDEKTLLPRFDKLEDDRCLKTQWRSFVGRPDLVLLEGWCWGALPGDPAALEEPINEREAREDPDGFHRRYVHRALGGIYQELFRISECHIHLQAPDFDACLAFRVKQARADFRLEGRDPRLVDPARVSEFLQLFQRVGQLQRRVLPGLVIELSREQKPMSVRPIMG